MEDTWWWCHIMPSAVNGLKGNCNGGVLGPSNRNAINTNKVFKANTALLQSVFGPVYQNWKKESMVEIRENTTVSAAI